LKNFCQKKFCQKNQREAVYGDGSSVSWAVAKQRIVTTNKTAQQQKKKPT